MKSKFQLINFILQKIENAFVTFVFGINSFVIECIYIKNVTGVLEMLLFVSMQICLCSKLDKVLVYLFRLHISNYHLSSPLQNYPNITNATF